MELDINKKIAQMRKHLAESKTNSGKLFSETIDKIGAYSDHEAPQREISKKTAYTAKSSYTSRQKINEIISMLHNADQPVVTTALMDEEESEASTY